MLCVKTYNILMQTRKIWIAAVVGLTVIVILVLIRLSAGPRPVNVVLISVDTLRPDHLGCYGYEDIQTPNIDLLSNQGITFEDVLSPVPLTLPSHASVMTGLFPFLHGVRENGSFVLAPDFVTLAEVLREKGYATGAFVGAFVIDSRYGLDQGFTVYDDDMSGGRQTSVLAYPERPANLVTDSALDWLGGVDQPFFCFVHYFDPHASYDPPPKFRELYPENLYDGEIVFTDHEVGRLVGFLKEKGLLETTLVVLISDHGEGLGEHGEDTHGLLVYEPTLKVPLIIRMPRDCPLHQATGWVARVSQNVRLIDVFPTILEIVGLGAPDDIDGRSLVPLMKGEDLRGELCYFESLYPYLAYRWSPLRGVRSGHWKFILAPEEELYDVDRDPKEKENLAAANMTKVEELKTVLARFAQLETGANAASEAKVGAQELGKLRSLGYVSHSNVDVPRSLEAQGKDPKEMIGYLTEYLNPGQEALDEGDFDLALENFTKLAQLDPANPSAQIYVAKVFFAMNDYDRAKKAFRKVIELDPESSTPYFRLGNIAQAEGMLDEAEGFYKKALEIIPDSPEALANLASLLVARGRIDSAAVLLNKALEVDPRNVVGLINLGLVYSAKQSYDQALDCFHRVLRVDEHNVKALSNCAVIHINRGEIDSTIVYFDKACDAAPNDPTPLVNLGSAYRQKGLPGQAETCFERALEIDPNHKLALLGLAGIKVTQGKPQECEAILRKILSVDPQFEPAIEALRRLPSQS
jgi:arylsulfatase A-like enzyme/Tfp pilus assembly protein PilF